MQTGTFRGFEVAVHDPGIAVVTMNQPERLNGMTQSMKRDLVETFAQAQMDDGVRVLVITGSGRAFSAGDDISGHRPADVDAQRLAPDIPGGHGDPIGTYEGLRWLSQPLNVAMRSRIVPAEEALALGLVHEVAAPDDLMGRAMALARELAEGPQVAMRLLKRTIYNAGEMTFAQALDDIAAKTAISDHHPDAREGIAAFREKRAPRFNAPRERR